jgi:hypothetical protein
MVHSSLSLTQIDKFLSRYGTVGLLRIVYDSKGKETHDLNIALLQPGLYEALIQDGRGHKGPARGLTVSPFLIHSGHLPPKDGKSTLFVPVPGPLKMDDDTVLEVINAKLHHLAGWNILPDHSWSLNIPLVSRERGQIRSGCFISFLPSAKLSIHDIAVIRILLTDTYWSEAKEGAERPVFQCHWARERKSKTSQRGDKRVTTRSASEVKDGKPSRRRRRHFKSTSSDEIPTPAVPLPETALPELDESMTPAVAVSLPEIALPELDV